MKNETNNKHIRTNTASTGKNMTANNLTRSSTSSAFVVSNIKSTLVPQKSKQEVTEKIKECFEDPSKYFDIDPNIIIGQKLTGPRFDSNNRIIPRSIVGDPKIIEQGGVLTTYKNTAYKHSRLTTAFVKRTENNYDVINDNQLNDIFTKAKQRCINSAKTEQLHSNNVPQSAKEIFTRQEKLFDKNERDSLRSARVTQKIADKIKRDSEDLLMNRTDAFRLKKQLIDIIENKKPLDTRYGDNNWCLSLRREENPKFIRINYINIASNEEPIWKPLIEYPPKTIEIINRPNTGSYKDLKYLLKNEHFNQALKEAELDIKKLNGLGKVNIEGKNLLNEEIKRAHSSKGRKRLFKDPFAVGKNIETEVIKQTYDDKYLIK